MKTKVMHLTFDMRIGGTEQVIKTLIEQSDRNLFDMSILCIESPLGPFAEDLVNQGIVIEALSRSPGFDTKLIQEIRQQINQHKIDILHCHQYTPWVYGTIAALLTSTKVIFTEHGRFYPDSSSWKRKLINPWLHRATNATTAISAATRTALAKYENIPERDIQVIYNGISAPAISATDIEKLRQDLGIPDDVFVVGTIARLDPIKNHLMMLNAFKQVIESGINALLIIVGDGEMRGAIEKCIMDLELNEKVIMTGYQKRPYAYLALMDVYLLSSYSEGTSMTLLEAMALGKPCVVTDVGGNPEIIIHGTNGLVTPSDNATAFASAIMQLNNTPELITTMQKSAQRIFERTFSADSMIEQFQHLYRTMKTH